MTIYFDTPEDPAEKRVTLKQLRVVLTEKLPHRPDVKTIYRWMALPCPLPVCPPLTPGGDRTFLASHVLAWLADPQGYYRKPRRKIA
jgi:hypothetical protein